MTTHVFIVDEDTFKFHLEHMFAGTGAESLKTSFSGNNFYASSPGEEKLYTSMLADCLRVRPDDFVIFYLQSKNGKEGCFYGIFKIDSVPFIDGNNYLSAHGLKKFLPFRVRIRPHKVYPKGVTEWRALDDLSGVTNPSNMIWSLIYRKLRGNRGNTMITMYEASRILHMIKATNSATSLSSRGFSFDNNIREIVPGKVHTYPPVKNNIEILPQLINQYNSQKSHEAHLQAYITGNIEKNASLLSTLKIDPKRIKWIGNEVYCGVGMQKIDVVVSTFDDYEELLYIIELKDEYSHPAVFTQMEKYIKWVSQYYCGNTPCFVQPVLISRQPKRTRPKKTIGALKMAIQAFNKVLPSFCHPILTVEYTVSGNNLLFI